jgi:hypothetical protein
MRAILLWSVSEIDFCDGGFFFFGMLKARCSNLGNALERLAIPYLLMDFSYPLARRTLWIGTIGGVLLLRVGAWRARLRGHGETALLSFGFSNPTL